MVTANKQKYWYKKDSVHIEALGNHKIWPQVVNMRQIDCRKSNKTTS